MRDTAGNYFFASIGIAYALFCIAAVWWMFQGDKMRWRFQSKTPVASITRLDIEPGDRLLVTVPTGTNVDEAMRLREMFDKAFDDVDTIVVTDGITAQAFRHRTNPDAITVSIPLEDARTFDRRYHDADQMTFDDEGRLLAAIRAELRKVGK